MYLRFFNADNGVFQDCGCSCQNHYLVNSCSQVGEWKNPVAMMDIQSLGIMLHFEPGRFIGKYVL